MDQVLRNPPRGKMEKRRGRRFAIIVPVQAKWQETCGQTVVETAQACEGTRKAGC